MMAGRRWQTDELALAREMRERGDDYETIRAALASRGWRRSREGVRIRITTDGWHTAIRSAPFPIYNKAPALEGNALILADCHIPFHDARFCNRLITYALRTGISQVILAGDLIDWAAFGIYGRLVEINARKEIAAAQQFFEALQEFERAYVILGNHEMRLIRQLNYKLGAEELTPMFASHPGLVVTNYHWCTLRSGGEKWRISHPKNAHMNPCSVARRLTAKYNCHVAVGHDHVCGAMLTEDARHWAISTGVCLMPAKLDYISLVDNMRWRVAQGALIIRDGYPELLTPDHPGLQ